MSRVTDQISPMLAGKQLDEQLMVLPSFAPETALKTASERLLALNDIYEIFYPGKMRTIHSLQSPFVPDQLNAGSAINKILQRSLYAYRSD